jgi:hypothetical protein
MVGSAIAGTALSALRSWHPDAAVDEYRVLFAAIGLYRPNDVIALIEIVETGNPDERYWAIALDFEAMTFRRWQNCFAPCRRIEPAQVRQASRNRSTSSAPPPGSKKTTAGAMDRFVEPRD